MAAGKAVKKKKPLHRFTIYLLTDSNQSIGDLVPDHASHRRFDIRHGGTIVGALFVRTAAARWPQWARLFDGYVDVGEFGRVSSPAALLIVEASGRTFAITFGAGRFMLADGCWEERFGLRVALNCIRENSIRSIDRMRFDAVSSHARMQAVREARVSEFGLDIDRDLLRAVTGRPTKEKWGVRVTGMDALHAEVRIDLKDLRALLREYLEQFGNKGYRKRFPWVDQIAEVKGADLIEELTNEACATIFSGSTDVWLTVPEIIDWTSVSGFRFSRGSSELERADLSIPDFLEHMGGASVSPADLRDERVFAVDGDGAPIYNWSVFRCLYAELNYKGAKYVLSSGSWYRVDKAFVASVDSEVAAIAELASPLPVFRHGSEASYCADVAKKASTDYALMDQRLIPLGGPQGAIEFCDLFSAQRDVIHVKRYGASSVLSHLVAQGAVSAEAFKSEVKFREGALALLPAPFRWTEPVVANNFRVVFAIVSERPGPLRLPFFTRVNLRQVSRRLNNFGFRVALSKVGVDEVFAKTKKAAKKNG